MMGTPKVFSLFKQRSYDEIFPNVSIIGDKVDFFLECSTYDIILPIKVKSERKLDIFEEAVLKLIAYKCFDVNELAEVLCLTPDLINFIIIRLKEMNLLEDNGLKISENGKEYLCISSDVNDSSNIEYSHAKLFVHNKTGKILPYVHKGEIIYESVDDMNGSILTVKYGSAGNPIKVKGRVLFQSKEDKKKSILQTGEIRKQIDQFNYIIKSKLGYNEIIYAEDWNIESTLSDNICIHMQAVIQKGNVDEILVSDGFVMDIDIIRNYLKQFYPEFIGKIKELATQNIINKEQKIKTDTNDYSGKYNELKRIMNSIQSINCELKAFKESEQNNQDNTRKMKSRQKAFLIKAYSAFEWVLFYYILHYQISRELLNVINNHSPEQNQKLLLEIAKKIGMSNVDEYARLFGSLDSKRINRMLNSRTPELRVALSLAVLSAADDEESIFRKLLITQPGIMYVLNDLFSTHGSLAHKTITTEIDYERNNLIYSSLNDTICKLLPDYEFEKIYDEIQEYNLDNTSIERLNSEVCLSKELGAFYYYNILSSNMRNEWILISPDKSLFPEPSEYADILYRISQNTLYSILKDLRKNQKLSKMEILKKISEYGFDTKCYESVNEIFVLQILQNIDGTLGADAMVYLYLQLDSADKIEKLKELEYVSVFDKIARFRMHGNNISLNVELQELNQLRDKLIKIVRFIGGI